MTTQLFFSILFSSMLPVMELRGAIPFYLATFPEVSVFFIMITAIIGNTLPNFFLLYLVPRINDWFYEHSRVRSFLHKITGKIHEKHGKHFEKYGILAILLIASMPLPGIGSYTAAVLAALFRLPYLKSMGVLLLGNIIAALIVTAASTGILSSLGWQ